MPRPVTSLLLLSGLMASMPLLSQTPADMPGHAALGSASACAPCHTADAQARLDAHRGTPCTPYCLTCHAKDEMARHHPVGNPVNKSPRVPLRLTQDQKSACFTCHDLANRRLDTVRWQAESLYARLIRREKLHKTYFLATRNDRGQLCLACH